MPQVWTLAGVSFGSLELDCVAVLAEARGREIWRCTVDQFLSWSCWRQEIVSATVCVWTGAMRSGVWPAEAGTRPPPRGAPWPWMADRHNRALDRGTESSPHQGKEPSLRSVQTQCDERSKLGRSCAAGLGTGHHEGGARPQVISIAPFHNRSGYRSQRIWRLLTDEADYLSRSCGSGRQVKNGGQARIERRTESL